MAVDELGAVTRHAPLPDATDVLGSTESLGDEAVETTLQMGAQWMYLKNQNLDVDILSSEGVLAQHPENNILK